MKTTGFHWCHLYSIECKNPIGWPSIQSFHTEKIDECEFQERILISFKKQ